MTKKNYKLPDDFNWKLYLYLNPDLNQNINEEEAINHYFYFGIREGRKYKLNENDFFLNNKNSNREIPDDFNYKNYLSLNTDLDEKLSEAQAIDHFLNFGIIENRRYKQSILPEDFDWKVYLKINTDLDQDTCKESVIHHYLNHGFYENRKYKYDLIFENPKFTQDILKKNFEDDLFIFPDCYNETILPEDPNLNLTNEYTICDKFDHLEDKSKFMLRTICFLKPPDKNFLRYNLEMNVLDKLKNFILVIDFNNGGGGTSFFLNTIISKYKNYQTFIVARNSIDKMTLNINVEYNLFHNYDNNNSTDFLEKYKDKIIKVFVNHTMSHNNKFLNKLFELGKDVIAITHDYHLLIEQYPQPFFHEIHNMIKKNPNPIDINKYSMLITQSHINTAIFSKYYKKKISVVELPDYKNKLEKFESSNKNITVIGIIGSIINIKGRPILEKIINYYKNDKNYKVIVIGHVEIPNFKDYYYYNSIEEYNNLLILHKLNIIIELSLWPETYSYSLSLSMLTDLPILYLKKKFNSVVEKRLSKYSKAYDFSSLKQLTNLINKKKQNYFFTIEPTIYFNKFWNELFITKTEKMNIEKKFFKNNVKPFFIYFPQFHEIEENNLFFYNKYNDIKNLKLLNFSSHKKTPEPDIQFFNLSTIDEYDLTNKNIIQKQIDFISDYNFEGLAIYYYWFSENNVTNKNMIFKKPIDTFFSDDINLNDKKLFFIWANENWTDNKAFGNNKNYKIKNNYDIDSFKKNSINMLKYFKHNNYLKVDNKPVLFIYHSYLMTDEDIDIFYNILNLSCILNGFNGLHLVLNSFTKQYSKYKNFYINFNYKKYDSRYIDNKQLYLDYKTYIDTNYHIKLNNIQTIVYNFNNTSRLLKPNRLENSTITINNSEINKIFFTQNLLQTYNNDNYMENNKVCKKSYLDNILLVNALNEWGEEMTFEPSNKYGFYDINLLYECLTE